MKAVVLTGGKGTRLKPLTNKVSKCAIKINSKPLVCYSLDTCQRLFDGKYIDEVIVIVGCKTDDIANAVESNGYSVPIFYADQFGNSAVSAISSAKRYLNQEPFLLMLGDEIFIDPMQENMFGMLKYDHYLSGVIGYVNGTIQEILKTYTLDHDRNYVKRLIEKPPYVFNDMIGTGNCIIPYEFFDWMKYAHVKHVGDFVTVLQYGLDLGYNLGHAEIGTKYFNINDIDDYGNVTNYFQENMQ